MKILNYSASTVCWIQHAPERSSCSSCEKVEIVDDSVFTPATARGFAYGFFFGHLWDVLLWSRSSRSLVSFRQVARDGGVEGMSRGKSERTRKGQRHLSFCDCQWLNRTHSSPRLFFVVSPRCSPSAISAVGPYDGWRRATLTAGSGTSANETRGVPKELHAHYLFGNQWASLLAFLLFFI